MDSWWSDDSSISSGEEVLDELLDEALEDVSAKLHALRSKYVSWKKFLITQKEKGRSDDNLDAQVGQCVEELQLAYSEYCRIIDNGDPRQCNMWGLEDELKIDPSAAQTRRRLNILHLESRFEKYSDSHRNAVTYKEACFHSEQRDKVRNELLIEKALFLQDELIAVGVARSAAFVAHDVVEFDRSIAYGRELMENVRLLLSA